MPQQYRQSLTQKQKRDLVNVLQIGHDFMIRPTTQQAGSRLGTISASIGIPMILSALTGKGAPRMGRSSDGSAPRMGRYESSGGSAPRMGRHRRPTTTGGRTKKKNGKGLLLGRNSPFRKVPIVGAILYRDQRMSNHDLIRWAQY